MESGIERISGRSRLSRVARSLPALCLRCALVSFSDGGGGGGGWDDFESAGGREGGGGGGAGSAGGGPGGGGGVSD